MKENSIYDRKSIRAIQGKTADFYEVAKDCVAFSNAEGGTIDFGIEDRTSAFFFIGKQSQRGRLLNSPVVQCIKYDELGEKVNKWLWDDYEKNPKEIIDEI